LPTGCPNMAGSWAGEHAAKTTAYDDGIRTPATCKARIHQFNDWCGVNNAISGLLSV
jgi:hypothetical protein